MALAFNKFQNFVEDLGLGVHDLNTDTLKVYLSNTAPTATDTIKSTGSATEISAGNGYTAGGADTTNTYTESAGTGTVAGVTITWTATGGGSIGPFRYAVLYNDTPTSPADPLIGWWDYGSNITLNDPETADLTFGTNIIFTVV